VVDLLAAGNRPDIVDGGRQADAESGPDVDGTANDLGAMGGPRGERHHASSGGGAVTVPAQPRDPAWQALVALLALLAAAGLHRFRQVRRRARVR
jgi:hypothetical protein